MIVDDCWRRIGVTGDRSCAELERHIHCRNCAVYADAAQRNLQRPVEPEYREAWARELARPEPAPAPTDAAAMVFRIGAEWLAVPPGSAAAVAPKPAIKAMLRSAAESLHQGEAILLALVALGETSLDKADPDTLNRVVVFLRMIGLEHEARDLAVEVALANGV